ncbi:hypothetical protein [Oceanithermus desulfurans]|uniref:Uncharacterized protein n=3 Tax=Oceanithermus TaxID=208447 RepID=A0A511RHX8_9DEIN|nr:hypothetical protein [Oceanithermus desulfurans]MBB6029127.1 putative Zn-dependent protease [Oceanithermus desulfurans]GEM89235.1 hypothetical protein ODE01S_06690 [Oceanithermus desulfurans NBRC 100063]
MLGWVLGADLRDPEVLAAYDAARKRLHDQLSQTFPEFAWRIETSERRAFMPRGALDPVDLLEVGVAEKLHRHWDYVLVVVPNELISRHGPSTLGVPSSALEAAVISSSRLGSGARLAERLAALALHLLGHLWGLDHAASGPMRPVENPEDLAPAPFPAAQREQARRQLEEVARTRLEDVRARWGALSFYGRTFAKDPREILAAIWGYRPWRMPIYLGRLSAAAAVSVVYFLLTSDAWALGAHLSWRAVLGLAALSVVAAAVFIFSGQDLGRLGREHAWREQLARTRLVLLGTLGLGMLSLWLGLLLLSLAGAWILPRALLEAWMGLAPTAEHLLRYAVFTATIGVLGAALGGNLEEEREIKAELFFDEET